MNDGLTNEHGVHADQLRPGARIVINYWDGSIYGTVVRMDLPRLGWFAYDAPTGGVSTEHAVFHLYNVLAIADLWWPLDVPIEGHCCYGSYAAQIKNGKPWHVAGCPWRCRIHIAINTKRHPGPDRYPCARTRGHDGDCDLPERYR